MELKEKGLIDDKYEIIVKEFQTIVSAFYLLLVGIGMLFSYRKYSYFGINIFQYSDVFDFLLTPFRDFIIFVFSFITIFVVYLVIILDKFTMKRFPKFYNSKFNFKLNKTSNSLFSKFVMFVLYLFIFSGKYGKLVKKRILKSPHKIEITLDDKTKTVGKLIGMNNGYVFLLENNDVKIYPISNSIRVIKQK